jgi:predicted lipoprotein with Yx(FWY)xxD motif
MRKIPTGACAPAMIAFAMLALGACNRGEPAATAAAEPAATTPVPEPTPAPAAGPSVGTLVVAGEGSDRYLTDNAGRAVYILEGDDTGTRCVADCLRTWPVVGGAAPVSGVPEVDGALIGTTTRADGTTQVTYAGHPLYYFADDTEVGVTNGRAVNDTWGHWYLVRPTGDGLTVALSDDAAATAEQVSNTTAADTDADAADNAPEDPAKY